MWSTRKYCTSYSAGSHQKLIRHKADLVLIKPISFIQLRDLAARLRPPDTLYPA